MSTTTPFEDSIPLAQPLTHEAGGGRRRPPILSFGSAAVLMVVVVLVGYMVALWAVDGQSGDGSNFALASTFEATGTAEATSDCYIEPRELGYILMIIEYAMTGDPNGLHGRPEADLGTPWPPAEAPDTQSIYGSWPEAGEPAGAETTNRVNEVYSQYIACSNENDELRAYALFTNDGLARRFVPDGVLELRLVAGLPTSDLSETEQPRGAGWQFEGFERVEMLPDGRAVGYLPDSGGAIIFRLVDGRWLIDDMNVGRG